MRAVASLRAAFSPTTATNVIDAMLVFRKLFPLAFLFFFLFLTHHITFYSSRTTNGARDRRVCLLVVAILSFNLVSLSSTLVYAVYERIYLSGKKKSKRKE
jgi:hypothetical protein